MWPIVRCCDETLFSLTSHFRESRDVRIHTRYTELNCFLVFFFAIFFLCFVRELIVSLYFRIIVADAVWKQARNWRADLDRIFKCFATIYAGVRGQSPKHQDDNFWMLIWARQNNFTSIYWQITDSVRSEWNQSWTILSRRICPKKRPKSVKWKLQSRQRQDRRHLLMLRHTHRSSRLTRASPIVDSKFRVHELTSTSTKRHARRIWRLSFSAWRLSRTQPLVLELRPSNWRH